MTKLVIFDLGGVFYNDADVTPKISKELGISKEQFIKYAKLSGLNELSCGKISAVEFWKRFQDVSGIRVTEELWGKYFKPSLKKETYDLIQKLKTKYRVVAGTNTIEPHYKIMQNREDLEVFDRIYASNIIGYSKPDQAFYITILKAEGASPAETAFIDDTKANVLSARELGIKAIHFNDGADIEKILKEIIDQAL